MCEIVDNCTSIRRPPRNRTRISAGAIRSKNDVATVVAICMIYSPVRNACDISSSPTPTSDFTREFLPKRKRTKDNAAPAKPSYFLPRGSINRIQLGQSFAEYDFNLSRPGVFVVTPAMNTAIEEQASASMSADVGLVKQP